MDRQNNFSAILTLQKTQSENTTGGSFFSSAQQITSTFEDYTKSTEAQSNVDFKRMNNLKNNVMGITYKNSDVLIKTQIPPPLPLAVAPKKSLFEFYSLIFESQSVTFIT